jgi:glutamate 5-kinase
MSASAAAADAVVRARRVVVKVGSSVLTQGGVRLDRDHLAHLAGELYDIRAAGRELCIVSSGAVALGMERLGLTARKPGLAWKQAAAALGQSHLIGLWEDAFQAHGILVAQILLTHADLASRRRFLNARHTIEELLGEGALPVINENDSVSVEEIQFGDNDRLAALVTSVIEADLLVLLTDVAGLFDRHPKEPGATLVPLVREVTDDTLRLAGGAGTSVGTGGMRSKMEAARAAARFGVPTVIASGRTRGTLSSLFRGEPQGTLVLPDVSPLAARKHWIAFTLRPAGTVIIDAGAVQALRAGNRSLLPAGVAGVQGEFDVGDPVRVVGPDGTEIARGLASYGARELDRIRGKPSADIEKVLGYRYDDEAIRREDLVLLG